ncbi:hypothetical protein BKA80DRAFT_7286 [Phyllosticta citrichinensis]
MSTDSIQIDRIAASCVFPTYATSRELDGRLVDQCPLDNGRHVCDDYEEHIDLGEFGKLPLEILQSVLVKLDLRTLTDIRRVNERATQVVDTVPEYKAIFKHASIVLRAVISVEVASFISCKDLYSELGRRDCRQCGRVAAYLHLLACERFCNYCLGRARPIRMMEERYLYTIFSETEFKDLNHTMEKFPYIRTLPGAG